MAKNLRKMQFFDQFIIGLSWGWFDTQFGKDTSVAESQSTQEFRILSQNRLVELGVVSFDLPWPKYAYDNQVALLY